MDQFSLAGKNIVVTGASSGIGRKTAIACSEAGARVILLARNSERLNETLVSLKNPDYHLAFPVDLLDAEALELLVKQIVEKAGRLHGLVNAAGISTTMPLKMTSPAKLNDYFNSNVVTAVNLSRIITKSTYMTPDGGSVILFSSVMGMVGEVGKTIYSITKGALIAASRSMALELAPRKIRVNAISPGVVLTPMSQQAVYSQDKESLDKVTALHPLGLGLPEDIANACVYLLSDASRWVSGSNLVVDGGYTAR